MHRMVTGVATEEKLSCRVNTTTSVRPRLPQVETKTEPFMSGIVGKGKLENNPLIFLQLIDSPIRTCRAKWHFSSKWGQNRIVSSVLLSVCGYKGYYFVHNVYDVNTRPRKHC